MIYEVFRQERKGQPFQHAGSFEAPAIEFAKTYASEFYGRRGESEALWVVPRGSLTEVVDFVDELGRNYHRVDGYSLKAKLKEARDRAVSGSAAVSGSSGVSGSAAVSGSPGVSDSAGVSDAGNG